MIFLVLNCHLNFRHLFNMKSLPDCCFSVRFLSTLVWVWCEGPWRESREGQWQGQLVRECRQSPCLQTLCRAAQPVTLRRVIPPPPAHAGSRATPPPGCHAAVAPQILAATRSGAIIQNSKQQCQGWRLEITSKMINQLADGSGWSEEWKTMTVGQESEGYIVIKDV